MKQLLQNLRNDTALSLGLALLLISALVYGATFSEYQNYREAFTPLFFIHYALAILYVLYLIVQKKLRLWSLFGTRSLPYHLILLMLFNISAYSLNQTIAVFHESVDWLAAFLLLENLLLLFYLLKPNISKTLASLFVFTFTLALIFNLYQSLMIFPYLAVGLAASPFLGISLHVLVPFAYMLALSNILLALVKKGASWVSFALACSCCFLLLGFYIIQWTQINNTISKTTHRQYFPGTQQELPLWVQLAQTLPDNTLTEKALQSGLIYQEYSNWSNWSGVGLRFEETKLHDPLLSIASFAGGKIELDSETKIKILDARYNMRHESADRFWSGLNLKTSDVISNVQLFPSYRLAYTEMILRIRNEDFNSGSSWFSQQEALYTFQLPEGGTVSSLSLWIGGKEAKARLSTKSKAEKAYNTIVGREARDPSVVYWMEGNKIRVRIFPCTPAEDRQFKIGITSPLSFDGTHLSYRNISFQGPDFEEALSSVNVLVQASSEVASSKLQLEKSGNTYSWSGNYQPNWQLSTKALPLSEKPFYFQGNAYSIKAIKPGFSPFNPEEIYLDLHQGWEAAEVKQLADLFQDKKFGVYDYASASMQQLSPRQVIQLLESGTCPQFSLFPIHKIPHPEKSLLISKGNKATPNLSDIRETEFSKALFSRIGHEKPLKVFELHYQSSDYLRTLNEFKVLQYAQGPVSKLDFYLKAAKFPLVSSGEDVIALAPAGILVEKKPAETQASNAPDHLLRLFSYNQVLSQIGRNYFREDYLQEEVIREATLGNVVSPISSLIVLETLEDYKRFEIEENKDSLGNAAINASGAVPEPHEWALIIMGVLFLSWMYFFKGKTPFSI